MAVIVQALPGQGRLEIDVKVTADVNVSAFSCVQKVNSFVLNEYQLIRRRRNPTMVLAERMMACPVVLSQTSRWRRWRSRQH